MIKNEGLVCYYPTTIIVIDDDADFLRSIEADLDIKNANYMFFSDPAKALSYLTEDYYAHTFFNRCLTVPNVSENKCLSATRVDINRIHQEVYNKSRFKEISVVVVDYDMPGLNGLDFFRQIDALPVKRLLLTGYADDKLAIDAFNERLINKFIRKETDDFSKVINTAINDLQKDYFYQFSHRILQYLTNSIGYANIALTDHILVKYFWDICAENNICEYYLMNDFGSYLMLDMYANLYWFVLANEMQINRYCEIATQKNFSKSVIHAMSKRKKMPLLCGDIKLLQDDWSTKLFPATALSAREVYYYSLVKDSNPCDIDRTKILSYADFIES